MSVRVNLLPDDVRAQGRANRSRWLALGGVLVLLLVLGGLTLLQRGQISDAEDRLAAAEQRNRELEAELTALQPFADLQARVDEAEAAITTALGTEASAAGVLQDLSLVLPPTTELSSVSLTFSAEPEAPPPGGDRPVFGDLSASGRTLVGVSPGVERLLIDFGRAAIFDNTFVGSTSVDEEGVATFNLEAGLGPEVRTQRYVFVEPSGGSE